MAHERKRANGKLKELLKGPWPSFVKEIEAAAQKSAMSGDLLGLLERSYEDRVGHWKHGGIVGVRGYGGGVIGRYSDLPEEFPNVSQFHTLRVNHPAGWFYTSEKMRKICDIWERHGSGLTNMHGSTGDLILLGTVTDELEPVFSELTQEGFDLGGSGSDMRTPSCCCGPARCEWAMFDTLRVTYDLTMQYQDELHRPYFPYKFKIKVAGCPNDCVAAIARADFTIIGTWKDTIRIDQAEVQNYLKSGFNVEKHVVNRCPTEALELDPKTGELKVKAEDCVRCMHCMNLMTKAIRPGVEKGATILIGGKAPIIKGAYLSWVLVPFMKLEPPYDELKDLLRKIWDWWDENGRTRERVAELIERLGFKTFLREIGLKPLPQMVKYPRSNPYVFFDK